MTQPDTREPRWTPGPWKKRTLKRSIEIFWPETGKKVASVPLSSFVDNTVNEANAHLIAAAPELYTALDTLCAVLIHDHNHDLAYWQDALAALARARGEPNG